MPTVPPDQTFWIVDKDAPRGAPARATGLPRSGCPRGGNTVFATASAPAALPITPGRLRGRFDSSIATATCWPAPAAPQGPEDAAEVQRLFSARPEELTPARPDPASVRSCGQRPICTLRPCCTPRTRTSIERFSGWFEETEVLASSYSIPHSAGYLVRG